MNENAKPNKETSPRWSVLSLFGAKTKPQPAAAAPVAKPAADPVPPANARRILVVDDDEVIRKSTAIKLKAQGFTVSTAADGPSAIHAARTEIPDLILLDLNFPADVSVAWDGFGILSWLRRLDATKNIPVIIVTGNRENDLPERALAAGAAGFFNKPLSFEPLIALIESRLNASAATSLSTIPVNSQD